MEDSDSEVEEQEFCYGCKRDFGSEEVKQAHYCFHCYGRSLCRECWNSRQHHCLKCLQCPKCCAKERKWYLENKGKEDCFGDSPPPSDEELYDKP
jgi:hypothetical protein